MKGTLLNNSSKLSALKRMLAVFTYIIGYVLKSIAISIRNFLERISLFSTTIKYFSPDQFEYAAMSSEEIRNDRQLKKELLLICLISFLIAVSILTLSFSAMAQNPRFDSLKLTTANPKFTFAIKDDTSKVVMLVSNPDAMEFDMQITWCQKGYAVAESYVYQIYLDWNKKPLKKGTIVWMAMKRKW